MPSSNQQIHPTSETLQAWLRDELNESQQLAIEDHLTNCDTCAQSLDGLQTDVDPLLQKIIDSKDALNPTFSLSNHSRQTLSDTGTDSKAKRKPKANVLNDRWEMRRLMATGGIGEVWVARDNRLGRNVVVKCLRDETAGNLAVQRRFLREAKVTARLNHPGTAFVVDLVEDGPDSYYVMSLIEGRTLTETIRDHHMRQIHMLENPHDHEGQQELLVSLNRLMNSLVSASQVIAFAHLRGVLHRDLKSENVVMGDYGQVTVIDWGLATFLIDQKGTQSVPEVTYPVDSNLLDSTSIDSTSIESTSIESTSIESTSIESTSVPIQASDPESNLSPTYPPTPIATPSIRSIDVKESQVESGSSRDSGDSGDANTRPTIFDSSYDKTTGANEPTFDTLAGRQTRAGARLGTPSFMAPEQARGDNPSVDKRTDVYGLGAIMYEMLTGRPPFVSDDVEQVLADVIGKEPVKPSVLIPTLPVELERICLRAISKDPEERQQSPTELAADIEAWISFEGDRIHSLAARRELFESTTDLMLIHDYAPKAVWANSAWESLGWKPDDLIGKTSTELIHPEDIGPTGSIVGPMKSGKSLSGLKMRMLDTQGNYHWYDWTFSPVPNEELVYAVGRNVNQYMRRTRREQELLLNATPDAIVILNRDRTIRYANRAACSLFGYDVDQIRNQHVAKLMPEFDSRFPPDVDLESSRPLEFRKQSIAGLHCTGTEYPLSICLSGVQIGLSVLVACCIRKVAD